MLSLLAHSPTFINNSFLSGIDPDKLKIARVIFIYKSGDKADLTNYHPISILPSISKIFEKAVSNRVVKFLEHNLILTKSQHGFRSFHNVNTAITITVDYITRMLDKGEFCLATFLDISKAFDY